MTPGRSEARDVYARRKHTCHATGCTSRVPPTLFMCRPHWFSLPKAMREAIWDTYRPGQCDDMRPSAAYLEAARAAITYLAEKEGRRL